MRAELCFLCNVGLSDKARFWWQWQQARAWTAGGWCVVGCGQIKEFNLSSLNDFNNFDTFASDRQRLVSQFEDKRYVKKNIETHYLSVFGYRFRHRWANYWTRNILCECICVGCCSEWLGFQGCTIDGGQIAGRLRRVYLEWELIHSRIKCIAKYSRIDSKTSLIIIMRLSNLLLTTLCYAYEVFVVVLCRY